MRLAKVEYEFFDFEEASAEAVELDRQIRLRYGNRSIIQISWTWERSHSASDPAYSIGFGAESYFTDDPSKLVDASASALWAPLVGTPIELCHIDPECFVLEVTSGAHSVFCAAWDHDTIRLSSGRPELLDAA